ncbi:transposase family protein [Nostoc sp. PCC 7524]|uniref:ISL3 family transposase n=1 Tax=Nostoc sp. (strain ATCC 29411 / PCC 7524) TaxID=28072 RepID=UPI00029EF00B|nr:ISL3 family transposase [Nostoc sp. PCC 7524]AFY47346.1 transposase family protein [Nostoc sp. PCC 7524]AFY47689.1 transposase family protein [Nostoc sp. PCC 7524]AFY47748.1 transposase family protein [Nostoc sp. PCC 7524]AFY48197.1 transposase family protein [Nostoc sp. PCC 7524]AFY48681.1 transposase family protein [Nostoc sp. PCC 7524]
MSVLSYLLPDSANLKLENCILDEIKTQIKLIVSAINRVVNCPVCNQPTHKIHSRYERKLADLPWADYSITLQLRVRKFFCLNKLCKRRIFAERLTNVTAPWARRTLRLAQRLSAIGLANGGAAGVRLSQDLGIKVSRNTLLNLVRSIPLPPIVTPHTLGVDDFCFRKCKTYGTALIDLERRRPIALLKDAKAETLAEWLKAHPGVKVVSRDRSKTYESGIRQGAPEAIQVADRFHLLQNLSQTLYQVFGNHAKTLKEVEKQVFNTDTKVHLEVETANNLSMIAETNKSPVVPRFPQNTSLKRKVQSAKARDRRREIHEQVWRLRSIGLSGLAIAQELGVSKTTVFNYLRSSTFTERRERSDHGLSLLNPYHDYLLSRWNSGNHNTQELFEEIRTCGYTGSYATVARFTRYLKTLPGFEPAKGSRKNASPRVSSCAHRPLTPSRVTALVLRRPELIQPNEREVIAQLQKAHSDLKSAIELAQQFASLVRQRLPEQLDAWLNKAKNSLVSLLRSFAVSLESDYDAVKAGVTMSVSNGPVEGHINRLKMLKRQMYGRAKIDLLERRFLLAI